MPDAYHSKARFTPGELSGAGSSRSLQTASRKLAGSTSVYPRAGDGSRLRASDCSRFILGLASHRLADERSPFRESSLLTTPPESRTYSWTRSSLSCLAIRSVSVMSRDSRSNEVTSRSEGRRAAPNSASSLIIRWNSLRPIVRYAEARSRKPSGSCPPEHSGLATRVPAARATVLVRLWQSRPDSRPTPLCPSSHVHGVVV